VTDSAVDLVFGIIYVILIEYIILNAKLFSVTTATSFLVALLAVDLIWALIWRYAGQWTTVDKEKIRRREKELDNNIHINAAMILVFIFLMLMTQFLSSGLYIAGFIAFYLIYIVVTFQKKIIDLRIFSPWRLGSWR